MSIPRLLSAVGALLLVAASMRTASATPPNVKVNSDVTSYLQNEEQIWISPFDANLVIADWRDWRLGYRRVGVGISTDGGATWSDSLFTNTPYYQQSDPCLVGDGLGRFYACMLNFEEQGGTQSLIVVYRSDDNGVSWSGPVALSAEGPDHFEDKQFTTVDRTGGAYSGNYYCSWTRFPNPTRIMFVRSTDGAQSFGDTIVVGQPNYLPEWNDYADAGQFSIPVVDADGNVHVFWQGYDVEPGPWLISATKHVFSTDGGQTFSEPVTIFRNNLNYGLVDGYLDVYGMPNADCDISNGPYRGTIYISQCQYKDSTTSSLQTDVIVRKSIDNGATWSAPALVNDDAPLADVDQFHPWLVVNQDGVVLLIFYDQRDDPTHLLFNSYFSASFDGGQTYITNMRLSDTSINPGIVLRESEKSLCLSDARRDLPNCGLPTNLAPRAGTFAEYIGIHANHDTISAIWTDTRNGNQDCYSARFLMPFLKPRLYSPSDDTAFFETRPQFVWSTCWHESLDSYRLELDHNENFTSVEYSFTDLLKNHLVPDSDLPTGEWHWRVKAFRTDGDSTDYSDIYTMVIASCGDANGDLLVNITDAVYLIQYIFAGGPAPVVYEAGDANCDGLVNITDAVYLIQYIFAGGPAPCSECP